METPVENRGSINDITQPQLEQLSLKKIFFAHQSVGENIINGIKVLMKESSDIKLNISEISSSCPYDTGIFAHSRVGKNGNPGSKIDHFKRLMESGAGNRADIAFLKFCYLDINTGTDLDALFYKYRTTMNELAEKYPETTFIHVTIPLTLTPSGVQGVITQTKDFIKKVTGKEITYDNRVKYKFNSMMREEYGGKNRLFDLARFESTTQDGKLISYTNEKSPYYTLLPEYTDDGGHLNETGRKKIAGDLLYFLITAIP